MRIIAFDPSINECGWAREDNSDESGIDSGVIRTGGSSEPVEERLSMIFKTARELCQGCRLAVIEWPGSITYARSSNHAGKALNASSMGLLHAATTAVILGASEADCDVELIEARLWKGMRGKEWSRAMTGCVNHNEADSRMLLRWKRGY